MVAALTARTPDPDASKEFRGWAQRWITLAEFPGPHVDERLASIVALWNEPIPGREGWKRGRDPLLLNPNVRYRRGNDDTTRIRAEHLIEHELLHPVPAAMPRFCLGARLVDGVNAVPLATDAGRGRKGNVETDMLLLVRDVQEDEYRLLLVEVKTNSNNAWFAVVENLRQLRLFSESGETRCIFHRRCPDLDLPEPLHVTGVVLAPERFYSAPGAKAASVAPARALLDRMRTEAGVDARLATWSRAINPI